jgi:hypothetical protein
MQYFCTDLLLKRTSLKIIRRLTMQPSGESISIGESQEADQADPYVVSLVAAVRAGRVAKRAENITVVVDELQGTANRRRAQLLNSRNS